MGVSARMRNSPGSQPDDRLPALRGCAPAIGRLVATLKRPLIELSCVALNQIFIRPAGLPRNAIIDLNAPDAPASAGWISAPRPQGY